MAPRYTPNGALIADGYYSSNPYDTGRSGQRNAELNGGQKDTQNGWDYDAGRPKSGAVKQSDGTYRMPGGSGGSSGGGGSYGIPGAAQIAQATLMAKTRYQQRVADINNRRKSTFLTSGYKGDINPDTGLVSGLKVDPFNQYGQYQLLNRAQALEGQQVDAANLERGLGSAAKGGLAAQNLGSARFGWGQQDASFGQSLVGQLGSYDAEQQGAKYEYDQALWQAEQLAAQQAIDGGDFYPWGGDPGTDGSGEDPNSYLFAPGLGHGLMNIDKYINKQAAKKATAFKPWGGQTVIQNRGPAPKPKPAAKPVYKGNPGVRGTAGKKPLLPKKGR